MPFEIAGAMNMAEVNAATSNFKIAIVANSGEGKSWLAASCATPEEPAFVFDWDARIQSIAGKPNVTAKTYQDVNFPAKMPMAWQTALTDLQAMEQAYLRKELPYKWFIYDSATYGSTACMNWIIYNTPSMRREIQAGGRTTYVPKSYDAYKAEVGEVVAFWSRLSAMGNLIVTFHMDAEKAPDSTQENPKFTGKFSVTPPRYGDLLALFNDQWRIKAMGPNNYKVQTAPDYTFIAKRTLSIADNEDPNIRQMLLKHLKTVPATK